MIRSTIKQLIAPSGRGSVMVIAALLLSSASLRLMTSATITFAQEGHIPTAPMATAKQAYSSTGSGLQHQTDEHLSSSVHTLQPPTNRNELSGLISALAEREKQVAEREKQLEMRMRALAVADEEIKKRMLTLTETEATLRATLSLADEASEKDLLRLTSVYESMKPKDAAILFEEMEPNFAAGFLGRMRPDIAAQVLAGLSPQIAYSISVILAGRNAAVPKT